jgi:hypothetical protein
MYNGFRCWLDSSSSNKLKSKKKMTRAPAMVGKELNFIIPRPEFPDLSAIDKCLTTSLAYPHIPMQELQRVAVDSCGIPSMEVASENLMETEVMAPDEGKDYDQKV